MEELLKNRVVRAKIDSLSAPVKRAFIESLVHLYIQEAEEMIDVIEESRMELREDFRSFTEGTDRLRAESRMLEQRRKESEGKIYDEDSRKMGVASRNSRLTYVEEQKNHEYVQNPLKKRGKRHIDSGEMTRSSSAASVQDTPRSRSTISTRSLPTPGVAITIEEKTESVMKNLTTANIKIESERLRQTELLEQRKERRRQQQQSKEEKALELLEKALLMDKQLAEKKQQQEMRVKERLEEMKKKKQDGRETRADDTQIFHYDDQL